MKVHRTEIITIPQTTNGQIVADEFVKSLTNKDAFHSRMDNKMNITIIAKYEDDYHFSEEGD